MKAYRTKIKLKDLKLAIKVPPEISSPEVEIIILSDSQTIKPARSRKKSRDLAGILHSYAKHELVKHEKEIAWTRAVHEKHDIL
jgi:hypothetical protein